MCKHNWQPVIPDDRGGLTPTQRIDLVIELMSRSIMKRTFYCDNCGRTAHRINSHRGDMRLHHGDYFLNDANKVRAKFGWPALKSLNLETQKNPPELPEGSTSIL